MTSFKPIVQSCEGCETVYIEDTSSPTLRTKRITQSWIGSSKLSIKLQASKVSGYRLKAICPPPPPSSDIQLQLGKPRNLGSPLQRTEGTAQSAQVHIFLVVHYKETRDVRQETGYMRRETWDMRHKTWDQETGDMRHETWDVRPGDRRHETWDRYCTVYSVHPRSLLNKEVRTN